MKKLLFTLTLIFCTSILIAQDFQTDVFETDKGDLSIHFVKHASLFFEFDGKVIHIDPVFRMGNYENYPDADLILVTHHHGDHLDIGAIEELKKENTKIIFTQMCHDTNEGLSDVIIMKNGDVLNISGIEIQAVPSYNIIHERAKGHPFHPKGECNAYVIQFADKKVLIGGDTENTPEIKALENIDIAFLPMNLPYTMTPEMVTDVARAIQPKVLYPYHYSNTNTGELIELLKNEKNIEVRVKKM